MPTKPITKTMRLLILWSLDQTGALTACNNQQIADLFGVNRSTILRDRIALDEVKALLPEYRKNFGRMHPRAIRRRKSPNL